MSTKLVIREHKFSRSHYPFCPCRVAVSSLLQFLENQQSLFQRILQFLKSRCLFLSKNISFWDMSTSYSSGPHIFRQATSGYKTSIPKIVDVKLENLRLIFCPRRSQICGCSHVGASYMLISDCDISKTMPILNLKRRRHIHSGYIRTCAEHGKERRDQIHTLCNRYRYTRIQQFAICKCSTTGIKVTTLIINMEFFQNILLLLSVLWDISLELSCAQCIWNSEMNLYA